MVGLACVLGVVLTSSARSFASRGHCGPALCIRAERGWFGSVGHGCCPPAAWVLFGNFRLPADAAGHEGYPSVPPGKVLIAFGDFPVVGTKARWRRVTRLRLPAKHPTRARLVSWHVRFAGRAVYVDVKFRVASQRPHVAAWERESRNGPSQAAVTHETALRGRGATRFAWASVRERHPMGALTLPRTAPPERDRCCASA